MTRVRLEIPKALADQARDRARAAIESIRPRPGTSKFEFAEQELEEVLVGVWVAGWLDWSMNRIDPNAQPQKR